MERPCGQCGCGKEGRFSRQAGARPVFISSQAMAPVEKLDFVGFSNFNAHIIEWGLRRDLSSLFFCSRCSSHGCRAQGGGVQSLRADYASRVLESALSHC